MHLELLLLGMMHLGSCGASYVGYFRIVRVRVEHFLLLVCEVVQGVQGGALALLLLILQLLLLLVLLLLALLLQQLEVVDLVVVHLADEGLHLVDNAAELVGHTAAASGQLDGCGCLVGFAGPNALRHPDAGFKVQG